MTQDEIAAEEEVLVGMVPKPLSTMTEDELRAHVQNIRNLRTSSQSLRAELAKKYIKAAAQVETKIESTFVDF